MNARLVFIDESGFLMAPLVRRTWARRGCTPILKQVTRSHKKVSMVGALVVAPRSRHVRFYFGMHRNANITSWRMRRFLGQLSRQVRGNVIIVWDRFQAHRAKIVMAWLRRHTRFQAVFLPPYAPELNSIEPAWGYLKINPLANWAPRDLAELVGRTRRQAQKLKAKQQVLRGFLGRGPLFSCPD